MSVVTQEPCLKVQINQIDHTLAPPGPLDNSSLPLAPIIRIYGPSSDGRKVCVHVHQVYPYLYVEYTGSLESREVKKYASRLKHSLNHAIALSFKRNPHSSKSQFIRAVILVKGIHFYGFHCSYSPFLKILVIDPSCLSRVVTLLQSGTVMSTRFRTYENHLSFTLQFLCDFGLYGCGWIELDSALERGRESEDESSPPQFPISPHFRQSRMELEVDVAAYHILNRHKLSARNIHHKLEIPAPPLSDEPFIPSVRELWEDERNRRSARGLDPSPVMPSVLSDVVREAGGEWVSETRWWDEIRTRVERERGRDVVPDSNDADSRRWENSVMTTFESVEALWETEWKTWKPSRRHGALSKSDGADAKVQTKGVLAEDVDEETTVDVDVSMLESQNIEFGDTDWNEYDQEGMIGDQEEEEDEVDYGELEDNESLPDDLSTSSVAENDVNEDEDVFLLADANDRLGLSQGASKDVIFASRNPSDDESDSSNGFFAGLNQVENEDDEGMFLDVVDELRQLSPSPYIPPHPKRTRAEDEGVQNEVRGTWKRRRTIASASEETSRVGSSSLVQNEETQLSILDTLTVGVKVKHRLSRTPFKLTPNANRYIYALAVPSTASLMESLEAHGTPSRIYRVPYYSEESDVPVGPREYAGLTFELKGGDGIVNLEDWVSNDAEQNGSIYMLGSEPLSTQFIEGWEYADFPPSVKEVKKWLSSPDATAMKPKSSFRSQIKGPTQANIYGLKASPLVMKAESRGRQDMSVLSLETFAPSASGRLPDPKEDALFAVFFSFQTCDSGTPANRVIITDPTGDYRNRLRGVKVQYVQTELELINDVLDVVIDLNPDLITGWEIQNSSWGYLSARAGTFGLEMEEILARAPSRARFSSEQYEARHTTTLHVAGRHVFNLWRIMRSEVTLGNYTFENVVFNVLGKRVPKYSSGALSEWCRSQTPRHNFFVLRYFIGRTAMNLDLLNQSEMLTKTAEFARVFGVDFYSVISRGSQFKVESFMARIAKPESFVFISPSKKDVGKQNAAECLPLVMEPQSAFYNSPLVVLDFQSLYPSIMVSRNYCYSTCLGRVVDFQGRNKFGVIDNLPRVPGLLTKLHEDITVSPNGLVFVRSHVRKGLLPRMLTELLDTRVMVKTAMKSVKSDRVLTRILNARQLGLKYIANVTYGYTSASFSGRMPAVEIADSIVQAGRETLEKAIKFITETTRWNAEVVYGDTDSLFIYLPGRTREQAFILGQEIADTITRQNPKPMVLKFEKVYHPCVLLAKKRYVGWKFESPDDTPVFDAKGIETVRRDGVRAAQMMTETCLKILFQTQDLSEVKEYCHDVWGKLLEGRLPVRDFIFAKEVRLGTYEKKVAPPPGAAVAAKRSLLDPNDEPQYGERVPYVVVRGLPGTRLVDRAMDPMEFLAAGNLHLDAMYYITRVLIPPLERIFNLVGADVRQWFNDMPRPKSLEVVSPSKKDSTGIIISERFNIHEHFDNAHCLTCGDFTLQGLCYRCRDSTALSQTSLLTRLAEGERRLMHSHGVCISCAGLSQGETVTCISLDCPWLFIRKGAEHSTDLLETVEDLIRQLNTGDLSDGSSDTNFQAEKEDEGDDMLAVEEEAYRG
ncbi:hypothetical protein E1B28_001091 [Marasmius oreades]|uniref:DNA polymerase n=1 Tax=Marasmius oreades TaxID=181124 RepID=A0A9P8AFA8_9AGAR|nr:uncharacterized protein E1B28_001091 [Marasmius oreades]KAG7099225.1 hypothetical protein E1B28_001091 [Marasmius oreades]